MIYTRGNRNGILIVGDSLPSNSKTKSNLKSVIDPKHPVYNSLVIPIKYYLNNFLYSKGYRLPLEKGNDDFFFYINAIDDSKTKSNPDLTKLKFELERQEHKLILSMGNFAFWAVEKVFERETKKDNEIFQLGNIFNVRLSNSEIDFPIHLPVLHNIANLKFEYAIKFIPFSERDAYISYFHYVGVQLGNLLLNNKDVFASIVKGSA